MSTYELNNQAGTNAPDHQTMSGKKIEMSGKNFGNQTTWSGALMRYAKIFTD